MPSPAPPGSDSADDMHDSTLMPYISGAIGFFSTFSANVSLRLDVDEQPRAVVGDRRTDGVHHPLRIGHVVEAVERRDEVDGVVVGHRRAARIVERDVVGTGLGALLLGARRARSWEMS